MKVFLYNESRISNNFCWFIKLPISGTERAPKLPGFIVCTSSGRKRSRDDLARDLGEKMSLSPRTKLVMHFHERVAAMHEIMMRNNAEAQLSHPQGGVGKQASIN